MKYSDYVNIKQGSASVMRFSNGNTLPLVQRPFAMCAFCAQTQSRDSWFFHPQAKSLEGVRITHQPSPWIADYGTVIFMPQKRKPIFSENRWSGYRPQEAVMTPSYMKLEFLKSRSVFECTPAERGGKIRVSFDSSEDNWLSVLSLKSDSSFEFVPEENTLYAVVTNNNGNAVNFKMYCVVKFGEDQISANENIVGMDSCTGTTNSIRGNGVGIHLKLNGSFAEASVATSYISFEQAKINLLSDTDSKSFEEVQNESEDIWENYLSRIEIEAKDEKQLRTFYSCMYRAFLYPHKCYEINANGEKIHYSPSKGKVLSGVRYTDNGFWDTYRTCYPFFALVAKDEYAEMCKGFVNEYLESGWLPRWLSIGERGCMPSTLIDAVLCDAAVKGLMDRDTMQTALDGMLKHANVNSVDDDYGRSGAESYCKLGYVPIEAHKESINLTLDAAYGDWCIAVIARILGENEIAEEYSLRALNYKNLFDASTGFMRARHEDGSFRADFNPVAWGRDYTEGSAWQNSFAVVHDIEGLAELYGGKEKLCEKIDELFATPPVYENAGYDCEIHEMTEMAAADFGQCAISNQPSFHLPYIYSELGYVDKTSYWVERMCNEAFSYEDDGFPGDEDNGSMALWYVFSSIGIYPFCPGKNEYVRTKKLVEKVKILGKEFDADAFNSNKISYDEVVR